MTFSPDSVLDKTTSKTHRTNACHYENMGYKITPLTVLQIHQRYKIADVGTICT